MGDTQLNGFSCHIFALTIFGRPLDQLQHGVILLNLQSIPSLGGRYSSIKFD